MRASEFRTERRALKLTQQALADKLGISKRTIGRYEAGKVKVPESKVIALNLLVSQAKRWPKRQGKAKP